MLDFGFSEILLTSAIALVVLGPERLPKVARQVGNWMGRARAMARQLSDQLEREINAEELLKEQNKSRQPIANRIAAPPAEPEVVPPPLPSEAHLVARPEAALALAPTSDSPHPAAAAHGAGPHTPPGAEAINPTNE
jgi:sec-independent protein translocase protein TatB